MGWKGSDASAYRPVRKPSRAILVIGLALLLASPVSAWLIVQHTPLGTDAPPAPPEPKPTSPHDLDGDRVDDRLPAAGVASAIVPFTHHLDDAELRMLQSVPSVQVLHQWTIVDGAWITLDLDVTDQVLALPFVKSIQADPVLTPTLDVTTRSLGARDARSGVLADGTPFDFVSRGVWRRGSSGLEGVTGDGVMVALLDGGIDDRHPSLDDMDDDLTTDDPKVAVKLNVWAYAILNATVGQAQPVNSSYPYVVADPGPQPNQAIPNECTIDPTVNAYYCGLARPIAGGVLAYEWPREGSAVCERYATFTCAPSTPLGPTVYPEVPVVDYPPYQGIPSSPLPDNAGDVAGTYDLFVAPPFTALPHATALANAIAGTGDATGTPTAATLADPWAYAGVAPGAKLVDVNLFIGVDAECLPAAPPADPLASQGINAQCPNGPRGTTTGVQVNTLNAPNGVAQTGATLITGAEMVKDYNAQNGPESRPPIGVALIPLLDIQSCAKNSYDTLIEAAVDALAQTNVTVITSVGQDQDGVCVPANVPRTVAIGARDGQGTIGNGDDEAWPPMGKPNKDQDEVAKPDLTVPGVGVWTARSAPSDFYEVTGSSIAAAQAAGVAALVLEAGNHSIQGLRLKTHLVRHADGSADGALQPATYTDGSPTQPGDGWRDGDAFRGWLPQHGFGALAARDAVCGILTCPLAWEGLATRVLPDASKPFPLSGHIGDRVSFQGRAIVDDDRAGEFWKDRAEQLHFAPGGGVGRGVQVDFAFTDAATNDTAHLLPVAHAITDDNGSFNLSFVIPQDKRPGALDCVLWVQGSVQDDNRDGLQRSPGLPCTLSLFSSTTLELDLCGEDDACDPAHPIVSFLNDPAVDYLRGVVRLTDAAGQAMEDQLVRVQWDGADATHRDILLRTGQNTGEALLKLPIGGQPGIFVLNVSYLPVGGDFHEAATLLVPVTVSVGTEADIGLVGRDPGAVLLNDGSTLPIAVTGRLQTFLGDPIGGATVELMVDGRLQRSLGTARTDATGSFSLGLDARPLQSGAYGLYVRYAGVKTETGNGYILLPTASYRLPFTVVVQAVLDVAPAAGHRGELLQVNGTASNPFGRPLTNQTLVVDWIGSSSAHQQVKTDRSGRFQLTRTLPADEALGPMLLQVQYPGSAEYAPAQALRSVDVTGRSFVSVFPGEVRRGGVAHLQGFLYDDTGRPLVGQRVALQWGSEPAGNATTDSLGHYALDHAVAQDERAGPATVRVAYAGRPFMEGANAQGVIGVLAPTDLLVDGGNRSANQVLEFTTRLLDDQGHIVTDPQPLEVYIAEPRAPTTTQVTYLAPLDLSDAVAPELRLSHAYRLATGFGVSDGARVQVSLDQGRSWTTLVPRQGYPDQASAAFGGPAFNGQTTGWFPQSLDLSGYGNESSLRLRWRAVTSPVNNDLTLAIDDVTLRDGNRTLFSDDFERYGAKAGANYWSVPAVDGFVVGRESISGDHAGVIATNLEGTYPPRARFAADGPNVTFPALAPTYVALRYRLDTGNAADAATLSLRLGNSSTLLSPVDEPRFGQLPDTDGAWRWLLYEMPAASRGRQGRLQLSFQSDGLLTGSGFQVDEVRMLRSPDITRAPISADPSRWTFNDFGAGLPHDLDTYVPSQDTKPYATLAGATLRRLDQPILLGLDQMPFPIAFFGESFDRLTVYPQGVAALGDTTGQDPSLLCRSLPAGQACHLAEVPGFGAPLVAPGWDAGLDARNAFLATATVGTAPDRQFVVEWRGLTVPGPGSGSAARFSAVFHEGGDIEFRYGTFYFGDADHDLGNNATVGVGQPGVPAHTVEVLAHAPSLSDNLRLYLARVHTHPSAEVAAACPAGQQCQVIGPNPAGTYKSSATSEAIFESGVDLSRAGEAYLVARQFVDLGRGDSLTVAARPFGSNTWRNLPVLMGGQNALGGAVNVDCPGEWSTVVYDLSGLVGQRAKIRFQVNADGAGQDVGILLRDLTALWVPRTPQALAVDRFDSYLDTSQDGAAWWTAQRAGQTQAQPPWGLRANGPDAPAELGASHLALGGTGPLDPSSTFLLTSPPFDLRGSKAPVLQWWQRFTPSDDLDGAVLEVSTDGGVSFRPVRPAGDGYRPFVPTLNGMGWAGPQFGFTTDTFDLTPYTAQDVRLRLDLGLGQGPFEATWILDQASVVDRLGPQATLMTEDGAFGARWNRASTTWASVPQASAIRFTRDGLQPTAILEVTGAATDHRLALPDDAPRGTLQATFLYRGASDTFGGALSTASLLLQAESQVSNLRIANDRDGGSHLLRGRTFTVEGQLRALDGQALSGRLMQVEVDDIAVGSARTGPDGRFKTTPLQVLSTMPLGKHTLRIRYGGDPADHVQGALVEMPVSVKAIAQLEVLSQVAKGDELEVTLAVTDDQGKPLARTAATIAVSGADEDVSVITDANGLATFTTPVHEAQDSEVAFSVRALGSQDVLGATLQQDTVVPAAPAAPLWPWLLGGALLLAALLAAAAVLLLRRRRAQTLAEALAEHMERTRYQLSTGDAVRESIFALYRALLDALAAAGRPVPDTQTPRELATALAEVFAPAQRSDLAVLTGLFSEARYSEAEMGDEDRARALGCLQRLQAALVPATPAPAAAAPAAAEGAA